jgi:ATP-dependent DNA helicase RecG
MDPLASALQYLKGVGPRRAADLQRVGLSTVEDLLYRFPTRYEDRGAFKTIASLRPGTVASVLADVISCGVRPTRRPRFKIFEMLVRDRTGSMRAIWFNQPFLADVFHPHQRVVLYGKLELSSHGLQLQNPQYELVRTADEGEGDGEGDAGGTPDSDGVHTGRIVPIDEKTGSLTTKMQRALLHQVL